MTTVCSFITSNNRTKHTHTNKTGTQNQHFTCQLNMSSVCPPAVALRSPDDDAIHRRSCRWTIAVVSAMPWQSFVSVRQLRQNFVDGRPSAEGHSRWYNQPGSNPSYTVAIMQARFYAGARGPSPPICGWALDFWRFSRFFITDIVFVMTWKGPGARPPRILGLELHVAICLAQWTARSHAARNAVRYYHNHSLDGATLFSKLDSNKLRFNVKNEITLICVKFDADLININVKN